MSEIVWLGFYIQLRLYLLISVNTLTFLLTIVNFFGCYGDKGRLD